MEESILDIEATQKLIDEKVDMADTLDVALQTALSIISDALNAERGLIMLYDANFDELNVFAVKDLDCENIFAAEISMTIINKVFKREKPILSCNAVDDPRFSSKTSVLISGLRSVICAPVISEEGFLGLIYLDNRSTTGAFTLKHLRFLETCALKLVDIIKKILPELKPKPKEEIKQ